MASRSYQNFDLLIEAEAAGSFRARVTACPLGESPTASFRLPFDTTQLENLLLKLDPGRSGTRRAGADPASQASMDLGGPLFETVFSEDVMLAWSRSQDVARSQGDGLRLRLRLTDAPSIAGLPWELLYDRRTNSYLAQSERTPVVRYLEVPQPPRPLVVDGALRILVVISSPTDLPELDVEAEWRRVQDSLAGRVEQGTVKLDRLPAPTMAALGAWLRRNDVHILHFIGHGDYDERLQDGVIYFTDRYGRGSKVSPTILGPYLRDHDPLRLVLLNACQSARVDATDPFSGMAQGLVQQDCTAVVAMQFPISDGAATAFTGEFYGCLADGLPVDQAATSARKALLADFAAEWATPVLFLRAPDGRVFDHIVAQPQVTATPTAPPPADDVDALDDAGTVEHATTPSPPVAPVAPTVRQPVGQHAAEREPAPQEPPAYQPVYAPAPASAGPTYVDAPRRRRRWGLIAVVVALLLGTVLSGLAWYGSTLPAEPDGTAEAPVVASASTLTGPRISATHLTTDLTIDGAIDDWPTGTATFDSNVVVFGAQPALKGTWGLAYDDNALYFAVDVTEAAIVQTHAGDTSQLFKGDGVSFEFGTATPKNGNASLEAGDRHVMVGPTTDASGVISGVNVAKGKSFVPGSNTIQGLKAAVQVTDHGYLIEGSIPWSTLGVSGPRAGSEFGMNLNVSEAVSDGSRKGELNAMASNNSRRTNNDASVRSIWGTLSLRP
jgi:hypothetical protein